eukprot:GEZU01016256.1.p1 GENE.GEZU01016256.1~~GEZU01016256.1.p1  ORF type:complete len:180 (-),score=52.23 GEZU01016256.1:108-647(-)
MIRRFAKFSCRSNQRCFPAIQHVARQYADMGNKKIDPNAAWEKTKDAAKDTAGDMADRARDTMNRGINKMDTKGSGGMMGGNNTGIILLATGVLGAAGYYWYSRSHARGKDMADKARDDMNRGVGYSKAKMEQAKDYTMDKASDVKQAAKETIDEAKDKAYEMKDRAADSMGVRDRDKK